MSIYLAFASYGCRLGIFISGIMGSTNNNNNDHNHTKPPVTLRFQPEINLMDHTL